MSNLMDYALALLVLATSGAGLLAVGYAVYDEYLDNKGE